MLAISIVVGALALLAGRKLYWLFVGLAGFAVGTTLAATYLAGRPEWLVLIIGVGAGLLGAVLAVFLQRLAIGLSGFLVGGYLVWSALAALDWRVTMVSWILVLVGAVVGLVLVAALFDWALIMLSSLAGANLITQAVNVRASFSALLFVVLVLVGVGVQGRTLLREKQKSGRPETDTSD